MNVRSYEGLQDLNAMLDLLTTGAMANSGTHYVHRGDLQWWLFYTDTPQEVWQSNIRLWLEDDCLVGWALLSTDEQAFDVFVASHLRGSTQEQQMLAWAVDQMSAVENLQNMWVAPHDDVRIHWLSAHGFQPKDGHTVYFRRSLSGPLDEPSLPEGFSIRTSRGEEDARLRAACSHAAFGSTKPFEDYWPRTVRLMQSPVYVPEHELFVIAPGGEVASYCIIWTDETTKVGHFEPVGTHPNFQRRGLGKCLLFDAMRRLKAEGMQEADLCTNHDNESAVPLYESVGFHKADKLLTYVKRN
jgi:ribosomal protein S18 acetylase RimI-like enzyme